jgi:hypothetical protein
MTSGGRTQAMAQGGPAGARTEAAADPRSRAARQRRLP